LGTNNAHILTQQQNIQTPKKKMDTKVRFVGVGYKCPNKKIYGLNIIGVPL
jgi:hypothetical protein